MTAASNMVIVATLSQIQGGREGTISYFSRALSDLKKKCYSNELELQGIVTAIGHFRQYLIEAPFVIYTDSIFCMNLLLKPMLSPRLHRWALMIQDYQFEVGCKKGKTNMVAVPSQRSQQSIPSPH